MTMKWMLNRLTRKVKELELVNSQRFAGWTKGCWRACAVVHCWSMNWKRLLVYITGSVDQELLARNEYLVTENRILRNQIKGRVRLTNPERVSLAEIGKRLGRKALEEVAQIVRPETILGWHWKLIARKFDGSKSRSTVGRAVRGQTIEVLVLQFARENRAWVGGRKSVAAELESSE